MDCEKALLIDLESTRYELPPTLASLEEIVTAARQDYLDANKAYHEAWKQTPVGRRLNTLNNIILGIIAVVSGISIGGMLFLLGYAILFEDPNASSACMTRKVPVEAHIMSKCPDARDCLRDLVLPSMQQIAPYVDFTLSYIGNATSHDDTVDCLHGPSECLGDIIQLCAADMYPDPKIYLGFTMCLSRQYREIPSQALVRACALEHGISFDRLNDCASRDDGSFGMGLLRQSVERSAEAGVERSCTVRIDGKEWCVRDGGMWVDCNSGREPEDMIDEVMRLRKTDFL